MLGFAHATIVEAACVHVPVTDSMIDDHGLIADPEARTTIAGALERLARQP